MFRSFRQNCVLKCLSVLNTWKHQAILWVAIAILFMKDILCIWINFHQCTCKQGVEFSVTCTAFENVCILADSLALYSSNGSYNPVISFKLQLAKNSHSSDCKVSLLAIVCLSSNCICTGYLSLAGSTMLSE